MDDPKANPSSQGFVVKPPNTGNLPPQAAPFRPTVPSQPVTPPPANPVQTPPINQSDPPPATSSLRPAQPPPPPARPITPPAGIPVKESNLSNVSPSPAPHIPASGGSIRTMSSDMGKPIQNPPSTQVQKPQIPPQTAPSPAPSFKPQNPPPQARPSIIIPSVPQKTSPSPQIVIPKPKPVETPNDLNVNIPPSSGSNRGKMIWYIVGLLVLIALAVLGFIFAKGRSSTTPTKTPTPATSKSPTPTPTITATQVIVNFEYLMKPIVQTQSDLAEISRLQSVSIGEIKTFTIPSNVVQFPVEISSALDLNKSYFMIFGKSDGSKGRGFAYKIQDSIALQSALATWEKNMTNDLKSVLLFDPAKAFSPNFLTNNYNNVLIKYRNFPDPLTTIDYAIVRFPQDEQYLILTNTRDHMFGVINKSLENIVIQ